MNEADFRKLISGERSGFLPQLQRAGLKLLSYPYRATIRTRNRLFDLGLKRTHHVDATVISVGNITTGGTGKTPFVAWLADHFSKQNHRVALLSRGYGSAQGQPNDEKRVLEQLCPGVPHLQNPDRVAIAGQAIADHKAQVLILDDGFQHRRLGRNFDVVLIDAMNPFGYGDLLPRGLLREPVASLARADAVVITRVDSADHVALLELRQTIGGHNPHAVLAEVEYRPTRLLNSSGDRKFISTFSDQPIAAFCGIGHPEAFEKTLTDLGLNLSWLQPFPDHHHYSDGELTELADKAAGEGIIALLTTQKDLVKINQTALAGLPLWAVQIETHFIRGEAEFTARLDALIG